MELAAKLVLVIVIAWLSNRRTRICTATPLSRLHPVRFDSIHRWMPDLHHI